MTHLARCSLAALAALTAGGSLASAAPHEVCVPYALGVPTRNDPPKWVSWAGSPGPVDASLDDPRWQGATGQGFSSGSAKAPLAMRALWSDEGGEYLYLSFVMDLEGLSGTAPPTQTPRDLFLGFRRATPFDPGTPGDPSDDHLGYIFQFHLRGGAEGSLVEPAHCARPLDSSPGANDGCSEDAAQPKDHWRVYVDRGQTGSCDVVTGTRFSRLIDAGQPDESPATWVKDKQAVRYWKQSTANRWAIQLRIPLVAAGQPLSAGIERGARFWYQATVVATAGAFTNISWFPRETPSSVCYTSAANGFLVHPGLTTADSYSALTTFNGTPPASSACDKGIKITTAGIGSLPDFAGTPADLATVPPTVGFKAFRADGTTPVVNTVVAQIENTSTAPLTQPLSARFRLASWGSAPWSNPADTGKWKDMRRTIPTVAGQQPGICLGNSDPNAADSCTPAVTVNPGSKAAFSFTWQLGNGALGTSEYCMYGLTAPGGCSDCPCAASDPNCDSGTGTKSPSGPCVSKYYHHQCLLVELTAPNGNVDFVQQSAWNNMNFDQMSIVSREALIDARGLPVDRLQKEQDIYLLVMPRNMPQTLPQNQQDGLALVRERALARAEAVSAPYLKDLQLFQGPQLDEVRARVKRAPDPDFEGRLARVVSPRPATHAAPADGARLQLNKQYAERVKRIALAFQVMGETDYKLVRGMLETVVSPAKTAEELSLEVVRKVGPVAAADVVPTLEIYPFYQPLGKGKTYQPMTAFSVFLSHEGAMQGMTWEVDGAERVGQNVFHMRIPVGYAKKIRVRAQAIEGKEAFGPGNPKWPCAGGCCAGAAAGKSCGLVGQLGNLLPGMLAGLYVILRGRRRRRVALTPVP